MSTQKPRIVVFSIAYSPQVGGAEAAIQELMARMPEYDFVVIAAAYASDNSYRLVEGNVEVYRVGRQFASLGRIRNYFYIPLAILCALRLHIRNRFSMIWSIMAAYAGGAAYWTSLVTRLPVMLSLEEGDPLARIEKLTAWVRPFYVHFFKRVVTIQALTPYLAQMAKHFGARVAAQVVPNGVEIEEFSKQLSLEERNNLRSRLGVNDEKILITTSRLEIKNGVDILLKALVDLPDVVLVCAGSGSLEGSLKRTAEHLGVSERVRFLGDVAYKELPEYYQVADVFARPSRSEGMGNSFIEAMAAGIPVIATPVGGILNFAKDKENMVLVPVEDPFAVSAAVKEILVDESLRMSLIEGGRITAASYDWSIVTPAIKGIIEETLTYVA